jgi:hypothetical protein
MDEVSHMNFMIKWLSALYISEQTYSVWDIYKDSSDVFKRRKALYCKARSMVVFDRIMNSEEHRLPL